MTESPALISVVYTSVAAEPFSDEALAELLVASRASNHEKSVTGMLLHREGRFIQFLEGPEATVRTLIATIAGDRRHGRVRVLLEDGIDARQFPDWTMGFASVDDAQMPEGFRRSFDDLENGDDRLLMAQAARDLTAWYRTRP